MGAASRQAACYSYDCLIREAYGSTLEPSRPTLGGEDANDRGVLVNMLNGILNLEEAPVRVECGRSLVVAGRH